MDSSVQTQIRVAVMVLLALTLVNGSATSADSLGPHFDRMANWTLWYSDSVGTPVQTIDISKPSTVFKAGHWSCTASVIVNPFQSANGTMNAQDVGNLHCWTVNGEPQYGWSVGPLICGDTPNGGWKNLDSGRLNLMSRPRGKTDFRIVGFTFGCQSRQYRPDK